MWERIEDRLALVELLHTGRLPRRSGQQAAWEVLLDLPWTRQSPRRDELVLDDAHGEELQRLVDRVWPEWQPALCRLQAAGLPPTERGWQELLDQERATSVRELPERLNQRTAAALVGPHSKAGITGARGAALAQVQVTRDGTVRLRPSPGLTVSRGDAQVDAAVIADVLGEVVLTERALRDGSLLAGTRPRALLLVENVGAYVDLRPPPGWLVAHVPGWDTATIRLLLEQLARVPVLHFGDLDPNGVRIAMHLRAIRSDLGWVVPDFWQEYVEDRALRGDWPSELDLSAAPPLVRDLAARSLWLEQETIVVDPRLPGSLEAALPDQP